MTALMQSSGVVVRPKITSPGFKAAISIGRLFPVGDPIFPGGGAGGDSLPRIFLIPSFRRKGTPAKGPVSWVFARLRAISVIGTAMKFRRAFCFVRSSAIFEQLSGGNLLRL